MKSSSLSVLVRSSALFVVLGGLGACAAELPDDAMGPSCTVGAADGGSSLANWSGVKTVIGFYCGGAGCHNEDQKPALFPDNDATLYRTLMEHKVAGCGGRALVKPCSPEESALYRVQAEPPMCDATPRMPFGCGQGSCTSPDDLEGIRQWIANGAPMD